MSIPETEESEYWVSRYFELGKQLPEKYPQLTFQNHCYWRIALDQTLQTKWDTVLKRPANKNLSRDQLIAVVRWLEVYLEDPSLSCRDGDRQLPCVSKADDWRRYDQRFTGGIFIDRIHRRSPSSSQL